MDLLRKIEKEENKSSSHEIILNKCLLPRTKHKFVYYYITAYKNTYNKFGILNIVF